MMRRPIPERISALRALIARKKSELTLSTLAGEHSSELDRLDQRTIRWAEETIRDLEAELASEGKGQS
jgi:hypothetical protein